MVMGTMGAECKLEKGHVDVISMHHATAELLASVMIHKYDAY